MGAATVHRRRDTLKVSVQKMLLMRCQVGPALNLNAIAAHTATDETSMTVYMNYALRP